jgi:hypothetical protein
MAASFQQQSLRRKLSYFGLIMLILSFSVVFRKYVVNEQAKTLEIREESLGEVELTGSAVRLLMTGSRGFAICVLWNTAIDKQMKHEWNELELLVNSITKLQPHFVTPWLFQSWNLAYNVSVESDRVKDKFFYVTRGIELLGEGERRIKNDPDLRKELAWIYQNKFGVSDEANTFRSLFQTSCIDPKKRDPRRFRRKDADGNAQFNLDEFEKFCKEQPHLVRRLRDKLRCNTPEKVVEFLEDNRRIPTRYEENPDVVANVEQSPYKEPAGKRFPLLPPPGQAEFNTRELHNDSDLTFDTDNFDVARSWYGYAQDGLKKVKPRQLSLVIFQSYPARAQAYKAEYLEKNGWIDPEGWTIKDWFPVDRNHPDSAKKPVVVGDRADGRWWSQEAWEHAFQMFKDYGELKDMLLKTPAEIAQLEPQAQRDYEYNRRVTNFPHFFLKTDIERKRESVEARKCFFVAEDLRQQGERVEALGWYENDKAFGPPSAWKNALKGWKKVFLDYPDLRADTEEQQQTYETQAKYLKLVEELRGPTIRRMMLLQNMLGQAALRGPGATVWLPPAYLLREYPLLLKGPFDDVDNTGTALITDYVRDRVRGNVVQDFAGPPPGAAEPAAQ